MLPSSLQSHFLYTKDSFMYRSRFSSASQTGAAGGVVHERLSDLAETATLQNLGLPRKVVAPKEKVRSSKSQISRENKRQRRMERLSVIDESILCADFSRIRKMAGEYRELGKQEPERYFQLRYCATFDDVKNGGPPFQIDGDTYTKGTKKWRHAVRSCCDI